MFVRVIAAWVCDVSGVESHCSFLIIIFIRGNLSIQDYEPNIIHTRVLACGWTGSMPYEIQTTRKKKTRLHSLLRNCIFSCAAVCFVQVLYMTDIERCCILASVVIINEMTFKPFFRDSPFSPSCTMTQHHRVHRMFFSTCAAAAAAKQSVVAQTLIAL